MNKQYQVIGITRETSFSGKRKVGLDTNILIKFYDQPFLFSFEESRIFNYENLIYTSTICVMELARYIKKIEKLSEEDAKKKAKEFVKSKNITYFFVKIPKEQIKKFEKECNRRLKQNGENYSTCHFPDSLILLIFKKMGINKVYSTDKIFRICASYLGIDGSSLPNLNTKISQTLRRMFKNNKKRKH